MSHTIFSARRGMTRVSVSAGLFLGLALSAGAQAIPRISGPISQASLVTLKGNTLPIANSRTDLGRVPDDTPTGRILMVLKQSPEQKAALDQLVADQQSSSSPSFHKFLTPQTYAQQFGVADADIQAVTGYLSEQGFNVRQVFPNKMAIEFSGTTGQLRSTFKTEIHTFSVNGHTFSANDRDPQIPASLASVVHGFASLNNYEPASKRLSSTRLTTPSADLKHSKAKPMYTDQTAFQLNVAPGDIAAIYDIPTTSTGNGVTIGVVNNTNVNLTYVNNYQRTFGLPVKLPTVIVDGDDPGETANEYDAIGQLELLSAVAPKASLNLYTSASGDASTGINFSIIRAVDDNQVQVLLYDNELCEQNIGTVGAAFINALAEQASAQGITVIAAAGNGGSDSCESTSGTGSVPGGVDTASLGLSVNGFASTPFVTAVGATDFYYGQNATYVQALQYWNIANGGTDGYTSAKGYVPEQPWNLSDGTYNAYGSAGFVAATGGGVSTLGNSNGNTTPLEPYPVPAWQTPVLPASLKKTGARIVPDVAVFGGSGLNGSNYIICAQADECVNGAPGSLVYELAGGTNVSSATFAGIAALVVQAHGAQGNINPTLYFLAESANSTSIYHAMQVGSNSVACSSGSPDCGSGGYLVDSTGALAYTATAGYNAAVGLGSVDVANLITDWKTPATVPTTTTFTLTAPGSTTPLTTFVHGSTVQGNVKVTSSAGIPGGDVSIETNTPLSNNTGVTFYTLSGGTYTDTTYLDGLPGGTYQLKALYAGDGKKFEPSVSAPFTVTVTKENSAIYLEPGSFTSGSTVTFGTPVTIILAVTSATNAGSIAQPTGAVTVLDGGNTLTLVPLDATGLATFTAKLSAGYHYLTFSYPGDASYNPSSLTTTLTVGVNNQPTTTDFAASSNNDPATGTVELVAFVNSTGTAATGVSPTGTISFQTSSAKVLGTAKLSPTTTGSGLVGAVAYFQLPGSKLTGTTSIGAVYKPTSGNGFASSLSKTITMTTTPSAGATASTTTVATSDGSASYFNYTGSVSFNVTVSGTGANPAGTVTLFSNGLPQPGATANLVSGKATITINADPNSLLLPFQIGTNAITVQYSGNASYAPSAGGTSINILSEGALPDFALQSNTTYGTLSPTVTQANFTLQLTSFNNFAALQPLLTFTATAPTGITCTFGKRTTRFATTSNYLQNTVSCAAAKGYTVAAITPMDQPLHRFWLASGGAAFACVFLLGVPARRKQWQKMLGAALLLALALGVTGGLTACSSNMASGLSGQTAAADAKSGAAAAAAKTLASGTYQVLITASAPLATGLPANTSNTQVHTVPLEIVVP